LDGAAPAIIEPIAVQDASDCQDEPRVTLFATDPRRLVRFGAITSAGETVSLAGLGSRRVYPNQKAADKPSVRPGDLVRLFAGQSVAPVRVRAIVRYDGAGIDQAVILLPLGPAQRLVGEPAGSRRSWSRGGAVSGAKLTDQVVRCSSPG
jgi:hypothetical protein